MFKNPQIFVIFQALRYLLNIQSDILVIRYLERRKKMRSRSDPHFDTFSQVSWDGISIFKKMSASYSIAVNIKNLICQSLEIRVEIVVDNYQVSSTQCIRSLIVSALRDCRVMCPYTLLEISRGRYRISTHTHIKHKVQIATPSKLLKYHKIYRFGISIYRPPHSTHLRRDPIIYNINRRNFDAQHCLTSRNKVFADFLNYRINFQLLFHRITKK